MKAFLPPLLVITLFCLPAVATPTEKTLRIKGPPYVRFLLEDKSVPAVYKQKAYYLRLQTEDLENKILIARGPLGGLTTLPLKPGQTHYELSEAIVGDSTANPVLLSALPKLCPRLEIKNPGSTELADQRQLKFIYRGSKDLLNRKPMAQLMDPDFFNAEQYNTVAKFDGRNVLLLQKITLRYDYEETSILDYEGPHPVTGQPVTGQPVTGKPHRVYEGEGGFYANFHYAILPYDKSILNLDRQTLLHLIQGKLAEIDKNPLRPKLRVHSFLPGPFLSRSEYGYELCEWGDTNFQAPEQSLSYEDVALWDWDYLGSPAEKILLIIWEGDEEAWMIEQKLLHPFYLTDDLVAIFEISRAKTLAPLRLINRQKDFEITVMTGNQ